MVTGQFIADLISWGAIGARTTESRSTAKWLALSRPVGFKMVPMGNTRLPWMLSAARASHMFLARQNGQMTIIRPAATRRPHYYAWWQNRIIMPMISPQPAIAARV